MTSFYVRRFTAEFRVSIEDFGQWLRWDLLPELPRLILLFGALALFISTAHQTPVTDLQSQTAETQMSCPVDAIAISTELR